MTSNHDHAAILRRSWLQRPAPLWSVMPLAGLSVVQLFPADWHEWRGGSLLLGWALFFWGWTASNGSSRGVER